MYFTIPILLNNNLTFPDGTKFYPDIKDGERGYNTDPARGADTFVPFNKGNKKYIRSVALGMSYLSHTFPDSGGYILLTQLSANYGHNSRLIVYLNNNIIYDESITNGSTIDLISITVKQGDVLKIAQSYSGTPWAAECYVYSEC